MQEEKVMVRPGSPDVATIVQALKMHGATVDGPTERDGELVYRINEHSLTETKSALWQTAVASPPGRFTTTLETAPRISGGELAGRNSKMRLVR